MVWLAVISSWISCAAAAICGIYFTRSPWCLIVMVIPSLIKYTRTTKDDKDS